MRSSEGDRARAGDDEDSRRVPECVVHCDERVRLDDYLSRQLQRLERPLQPLLLRLSPDTGDAAVKNLHFGGVAALDARECVANSCGDDTGRMIGFSRRDCRPGTLGAGELFTFGGADESESL